MGVLDSLERREYSRLNLSFPMAFNLFSSKLEQAKEFIKDIHIFDVFESEKLGADKKSIALNIIFQALDHTFELVHAAVLSVLPGGGTGSHCEA